MIYSIKSIYFENTVRVDDETMTFLEKREFIQNMILTVERLAYLEVIDQENDTPDTIVHPEKIMITDSLNNVIYDKRPAKRTIASVIKIYDVFED